MRYIYEKIIHFCLKRIYPLDIESIYLVLSDISPNETAFYTKELEKHNIHSKKELLDFWKRGINNEN